jgi:hypothetical protein
MSPKPSISVLRPGGPVHFIIQYAHLGEDILGYRCINENLCASGEHTGALFMDADPCSSGLDRAEKMTTIRPGCVGF